MKQKLASLVTAMILATSQVNAGSLYPEIINCSFGYYDYAVNWTSPWSESLIFMEDKSQYAPPWAWQFFIGYLTANGKYAPTVHNKQYRMMAQPPASVAYPDSNVLTINRIRCTHVP